MKKKTKRILALLCTAFLLTGALSENATPSEIAPSHPAIPETGPDVEVLHMLEALSGDYQKAEDTKEEPNPEFIPAAVFSESLSVFERKYPGFTPIKVEAHMDENGYYASAIVYYERNKYVLTIEYLYENGETVHEPHIQSVLYGAQYEVASPFVSGYAPDVSAVSGTMNAQDIKVSVIYTKTMQPEEPSTPSEPTTPSEPSTPGEPIAPDEPTEPSTPGEPIAPDEPTEPSTPGEPIAPDEPTDPSTPGEPIAPEEPTDPSTPGEPEAPEEPTDPSTPGEPIAPDEPADPSTPGEPIAPDEPTDPSTPGEPETPDEPADPSTPDEPITPDEPTDPSTPGEPATPSEPSTPSEPGGKPGGGRPGGGRLGGGNGQSVSTISPGEAATSYHAIGKRDLSAHWQGTVEAEGARVSQINLDGGSAVIAFTGGEGVFAVEKSRDGAYTLAALSAGTFEVNGFALKILNESGYDTLVLRMNDTQILIDTSRACASDEYALLKAVGVGERRITYSYRLTDEGDATFYLYADGEIVSDEGLYTVLRKEDDG